MSFTQIMGDPEDRVQQNLVDAAIKAGVKRFAPSQWGRRVDLSSHLKSCLIIPSASAVDMPWWEAKDRIHSYLEEVNRNGKVNAKYTLHFQTGTHVDIL